MKRNFLFFACLLFMLPVFAANDTLRVDFERSGASDPETGWEIMAFGDKAIPSSDFSSFSAMETTLKVRVLMLDAATANVNSTRAIFRNNSNYSDEKANVLSDWIAADVLSGVSRTLAVQVTGIPAGKYTWKSYHHDFSDQIGRFKAKVENKAGLISDYDSIYQISLSDPNQTSHVGYTNSFLKVTKYINDTVISAGPTDTITVHFTHEYALGAPEIDHPNKLLILNGFELYATPEVLPEIMHISPETLTYNGAFTKEFYVTGENLTEDIVISSVANCTITPTTLSADADGDTVKVTFDGLAAVNDYIYLTSGKGKDSVKIVATEYVKDTLRIDFNKKGITTTEPGWNVIGLSDKQFPTTEYSAFNALESEVKVLPVFLNNPIAASTRAIDRNKSENYSDELFEVLDDYIAADAIAGDKANGDHCNILAIKLTGVPAGDYVWKSYHHDTDDQYGKFIAKVESTEGYSYENTPLYRTSQSRTSIPGYTDNIEGVTKCITRIVSAGINDTITVSFTSEFEFDADTMNVNQSIKLLLINGFELSMAEPLKEVVFVTPEANSKDTVTIQAITNYMGNTVYNVTVLPKSVIELSDTTQLNAADVVIMGRAINSSNVGSGAAAWDSITSPVLSMNMWGLRGLKDKAWWTPNASCENVTSDPDTVLQADILAASDPVFDGLSADTIDWWNGMFSAFGIDEAMTSAGNGMLLAKTIDNRPLFVRWAAGVEFYEGAGHAPKGDRTFIGCGNDNTTLNYFGFTDDAEAIFFAELARMASGEATVISHIKSYDARLAELTVDKGTLTPAFDAATMNYTLEAPIKTEVVNVTATASSDSADVVISENGAIDVSSGSGTATVTVTAEDGKVKVYTIDITVKEPIEVVFVTPTANSYDSITVDAIAGYMDSSVYIVTVLEKDVIEISDTTQLNAADVVIMGRAINSSRVGDGAAVWDSITSPVLSMNMWGLRGLKDKAWWTPNAKCENVTANADTVLKANILVDSDPVFDGISETTIDWWSGMFSVFGVDDEFTSAGNGQLLAKTSDNRPLFIRWAAGVEFYEGAGHAPNGDRTFIGCGNDNTEVNYFGFTDNGKAVFFAELARMASGEATVIPDPQSKDATLSALASTEGSLDPVFDAATLTYSVELPTGTTTVPTLSATATDSKASVAIVDATALPGSATVTVTAEYSYVVKTYTVNFTVKPDAVETIEGSTISVIPTVSSDDFKVTAVEGSLIEVYDITGQLVVTKVANSTITSIDVPQAGIYLIKVGNEVIKVVKLD